jgi:hypothetical protein
MRIARLMCTLVSLILLSLASFYAHAHQVNAEWPRFQDDAHRGSIAYAVFWSNTSINTEHSRTSGKRRVSCPKAAREPLVARHELRVEPSVAQLIQHRQHR